MQYKVNIYLKLHSALHIKLPEIELQSTCDGFDVPVIALEINITWICGVWENMTSNKQKYLMVKLLIKQKTQVNTKT